MTLQHCLEQINDHFPELGDVIIKIELNKAYKQFCSLSRCLRAFYDLTLTTAIEYTLAADVQQVVSITAFDSSGEEVAGGSYPTYKIENGKIKFYEYDGTKLTTFPETIAKVTIEYIKIPTELSALSDTFITDSEFDESIVSGALSNLYSRFPVEVAGQNGMMRVKDFNSAKYFKNNFAEGIMLAKKKANSSQDGTGIRVQTEIL